MLSSCQPRLGRAVRRLHPARSPVQRRQRPYGHGTTCSNRRPGASAYLFTGGRGGVSDRKIRDFVVVEEYPAGVGPRKTHQDIKCCRLASPVWAEQSDDFTLPDLQFNVVNDLTATVRLAQIDGLELQHTSSRAAAAELRHFSTRCLVNVRGPFSESTMIVSSAKKKVN